MKFAADAEERDHGVRAVVLTDFNSDGKPDLALSDNSVLLGNGDGTFQFAGQLAMGMYIVAAGDFDGDGKRDLVALYDAWPQTTVSILLGRGDGTFEAPVAYVVGGGPYVFQVITADFNGDGNPDLAVEAAIGAISVLLGRGDGTLGEPIVSRPGQTGVPTVADLNGDGIPDLLLGDVYTNGVLVLLGNGDGTFRTPHLFSAGNSAAHVVVGDFDGDGKPDIAVGQWINIDSDAPSDFISVLPGNGDGTFQPELRFSVGDLPGYVATGDFNGDGQLDIVASAWQANTVSVLLNNAGGPIPSYRPFIGKPN